MKILLDTCTFLWLIAGDASLSPRARDLIEDPENPVAFSSASAWEIAIKNARGRLPLPEEPDRFIPVQRALHRIDRLDIDEAAALHVARLPLLHRDPFDRMLVSQAILGGLTVLTPDPAIKQYPVSCLW